MIRSAHLIVTSTCLAALLQASTVYAGDLTTVLECRDTAMLTAEPAMFADLGRSAGFDCRLHERQRESTVYCTGSGAATAFGSTVKEFNRVRTADGRTLLSVAFTQPPSRIEPLVARARSGLADTPSALSTAVVDQREDGVAELRCNIGGTGDGSGAIAGNLDFRGVEPLPAMRVCAAPVRTPDHPRCVETSIGQRDYLIEGLASGDYYVTAFALNNNPNRLFGVYTSSLQPCPAGASNCADQRLQRVTVFPGDVRSGIDPSTLMSELPSPLRTGSIAAGR
jgi:hypothetical protein